MMKKCTVRRKATGELFEAEIDEDLKQARIQLSQRHLYQVGKVEKIENNLLALSMREFEEQYEIVKKHFH
jgi:hypothetical protein